MDILLISWIIWPFLGILIGVQKNQLISGIVWALLLGPIGIVIVLCLPNLKSQLKETQKESQMRLQIELQRQQLAELKRLREPEQSVSSISKLRIAKEGQEIGEMGMGVIKTMLINGQLSKEDLYLDPTANEWFPLEYLP